MRRRESRALARDLDLEDYAWLLRCGEARENIARRLGLGERYLEWLDKVIRRRAAAGDVRWAYISRLAALEAARQRDADAALRRAAS